MCQPHFYRVHGSVSSPPSLFPCCCVKNSIVLCQKIISHETPQPTDFRSVSIYLEWRRQMNHSFMLQPCICHLQCAGILHQTNMHHTNSVEHRHIVSGNSVTDVDSRLPQFFFVRSRQFLVPFSGTTFRTNQYLVYTKVIQNV